MLRNELGDLPESFNQEQGRFTLLGIGLSRTRIICQARGNRDVIAIGQANDQVRVWPTTHPNELDTLPRQGMVRMGDGHPFHRWRGKGGSVL